EQSTNASFHPLGEAQPVKAVSDPIEAARIEQSDESAQQAEHHVVQQLRRGGKGEAAMRDEDRIPAGPGPEHAVANDRGDECGNDRLDFQVVFVEDFGCQHRPTQGGAEDGVDSPPASYTIVLTMGGYLTKNKSKKVGAASRHAR